MKRFIATLNGESYINIPADRMVFNQDSNMVMVYNGQAFVACVDVSAVITDHISEETPERNKR